MPTRPETAVAVGALSGLLCVGVGSMLPQPVSTAIMALGLVLPGLLLQDALRFAPFTTGFRTGPWAAVWNSGWLERKQSCWS